LLGQCTIRVDERAIAYTLDIENLEMSWLVHVSQTQMCMSYPD